ncbi:MULTISPECIES: hemolysin family protein [Corynebacterium]|uniref:hemolysin family protein n=1 Tax=Corynebacterium TaxID=1716 RepID=UPI0010AAE251|nr:MULTISPECIES: hemolysin family protein [Corynebacterium]MCT1463732.1 hemolysin family protein [Corynebacterium sanguinis]MCT1614532.1 hemolysin family protein [Corynebacterium sanguinis]MCT2329660.1 hemolysin family protein [Corynebacterium sanguinis]WNI12683.1 hemolysin family protein [Corynebacterium sp. Z-1]
MEFTVTYAVVALAALLASGLLGSVESALAPISRARVESMLKDDVPGSRALMRVVDSRANQVNMLVMVRTVLDVTAAVFAAMFTLDLFGAVSWAIFVAVAGVTLLQFGIIGVFARTAGRRNPYSISLRAAQWLVAFNVVLGPVARLLIWVGNLFHPGRDFREGPYATEIELREMVDIAQERGVVETTEHRMIQNIFDLASTYAKQVMVPRPEMIWIEAEKTVGQATRLMVRSGHSRVPAIGENADDIVGVVYLKDMFTSDGRPLDPATSIADVMREPLFIPESKPLDVLLHEMQQRGTHIAMLIDEYGGVAGLLTMEDLLEEIVGEITDEYDEAEMAPIEPLEGPRYRAQARLPLDDLVDYLQDNVGYELSFDDEIVDSVDTVAGLLSFELGRVPLPGSSVEVSELRFTAEGGRDRRGRIKVRSVLIELPDVIDEYQSAQ